MEKNKVLIVEDDIDFINSIYVTLRENGVDSKNIDIAETVEEANTNILRGTEEFIIGIRKYIAIILDLHLLNETTYELLDMIKESGFTGMVISTTFESEGRNKMLKKGCTHEAFYKFDAGNIVGELLKNK